MLGCIDPVLTIAAASSLSRSPFLAPFAQRQEAAAAHAPFRGEMSDQLGLLRAFEGWSAAQRSQQGRSAARRYCEQHFLSAHGMEELAGVCVCVYIRGGGAGRSVHQGTSLQPHTYKATTPRTQGCKVTG